MNLAETEYWIDSLLPGEMTVWELQAALPGGGRHAGPAHGEPFTVGVAGGVCATLDLSRFDSGLRTPDGAEVRVELVTAAAADLPAADFLATAATIVSESAGTIPPTPGTLLPEAMTWTLADLAGGGQEVPAGLTVAHGMLIEPRVWSRGTPTVTEAPGRVHAHDADPGPHPEAGPAPAGRITTIAQLIAISEGELALARAEGPAALLAALAAAGADPGDWRRAPVAPAPGR